MEVLTAPGLYGGGYQGGAGDFGGHGSRRTGGMDSFGGGSRLESAAASSDAYNSPGWRRMQANSGRRALRQPGESRNLVIDAEAVCPFEIGQRVFHQKFGYGEVKAAEGDKVTVAFEKAGEKKVVARFLAAPDDVPF